MPSGIRSVDATERDQDQELTSEQMFFVLLCFSGLVQTVAPFSRPLLLNIAKELLVKRGRNDDETIHSFFSRRLGKEVNSFVF